MVYQSPCGWPVILEIGRLLSHSLSHSFNQSKMNYFVLQDTLEFSTYLIFTGKIGDRPSGIYPPADTAVSYLNNYMSKFVPDEAIVSVYGTRICSGLSLSFEAAIT